MVLHASSGKGLRAPKLCGSPQCVCDVGTTKVMQLFFPAQVLCVGLLAGLRLLLFGLSLVSLFIPSSLWGRWLPAFSVRRVSSPPGEGAVLVLSVLQFFVLYLVLAVEGRFLLSSALLSLLGSCLWYNLDFDDFLMVSVFGPFCGILRVAGCPPGGENCGM